MRRGQLKSCRKIQFHDALIVRSKQASIPCKNVPPNLRLQNDVVRST